MTGGNALLPPSASSPQATYREGIETHLQYEKAKPEFRFRRLLGKVDVKWRFPLRHFSVESFEKTKIPTGKATQPKIFPKTATQDAAAPQHKVQIDLATERNKSRKTTTFRFSFFMKMPFERRWIIPHDIKRRYHVRGRGADSLRTWRTKGIHANLSLGKHDPSCVHISDDPGL